MNQNDIYLRLGDLPSTFTRNDQVYANWIDSLASALLLFCQASDNLQGVQTNFENASNQWLDCWGELCGVKRRNNESNFVYQNRVWETLLAPRDSAVAITSWISLVENVEAEVVEQIPKGLGYNIIFPPSQLLANVIRIIQNLIYVRPAGVPFYCFYSQGSIYLNTINYFAGSYSLNPPIGRVTGAYLGSNGIPITFSIGSTTNNTVSLLPNLFFVDPTLNPSLA